MPADESGWITVDALPAGRYEAALIVDDQVRTTIEVELRSGDERYFDLSVLVDSAPPASTALGDGEERELST